MFEFETGIRIRAPIARVFAVFSDPRESAKCLSRVRRVEQVAEHTYREWRVLPDGREIVQDMEVTQLTPGISCTVASTSAGIRFTFVTTFESVAAETRVTIRASARGATLRGKLLLPVAWLIASGAAKKNLADDLGEIQRCLEA